MNILVTRIFYFDHSMVFSLGLWPTTKSTRQKRRQINDNFDGHGNAAVRRGSHRPMKHIRGFTQSHWMPPSGECLRHIAPAAAMANEFVETTQNTNKT
jgi:hypothetical protein